jgi:hypothetical protein
MVEVGWRRISERTLWVIRRSQRMARVRIFEEIQPERDRATVAKTPIQNMVA